MIIKPLDIVIIALTAGIITLYLIDTVSMGHDTSYVKVSVEGKEYLYDINKEVTKTFYGPVGETVVEIRDGKAAIIESDCKNKTCIHMGQIDKSGQSAACLPNRVLISVEGDHTDEVDAGTY